MIKDFHADVGGSVGHEEMGIVIELQQKLHELENQMRIEKSLKLWGQMRLKMRDRKLKEKEAEVTNLSHTLSMKQEQIEELRTEMETVHKADHDLLESIN